MSGRPTRRRRVSAQETEACARCSELERQVEEWKGIALRANRFWVAHAQELVERERRALERKDETIARLRQERDDALTEKTRKQVPRAVEVVRELRKLAPDAPKKQQELALAAHFGVNVRTIQRRLAEFEDELARSMGVTVKWLREVAKRGRKSPDR
jgi:hypothetical protein